MTLDREYVEFFFKDENMKICEMLIKLKMAQ